MAWVTRSRTFWMPPKLMGTAVPRHTSSALSAGHCHRSRPVRPSRHSTGAHTLWHAQRALGLCSSGHTPDTTLMQHPVGYFHRDRGQLNHLMRVVRTCHGKRRVATRTRLGIAIPGRVVGGKSPGDGPVARFPARLPGCGGRLRALARLFVRVSPTTVAGGRSWNSVWRRASRVSTHPWSC